MRRGTIVLLLFLLIAAGIIGASAFLQNQAPIEVTLAVDPLAQTWIRDAVDSFNASNPIVGAGRRVQMVMSTVSDFDAWNWSSTNHRDAWIASSSASVKYAQSQNLAITLVQPSLAQTPLIFGGYASRINVLTDGDVNPLTWELVGNAAEMESWEALGGESNWRFVQLAFSLPDQTMSGLGVLLSAAADYHDSTTLSSVQLSDSGFREWFTPIKQSVSNFNSVGQDAAAFLARGMASGDIAIAPESQWVTSLTGLLRNEPVRFSYPDYVFIFDFPLLMWEDASTTPDTRQAITLFGNWLMNSEQQTSLPTFGLRPVNDQTITPTDTLFADAEPYGIQMNPTFANIIQPPEYNDMQSLLRWFQSVR